MRVVVAPDSFKECLGARAVAEAIAAGWRQARPDDTIDCVPIADGGEGTVDAILTATGGQRACARVTGPLGEAVDAEYGLLEDGTAVIEMAAASGLALVPAARRDPMRATTRGTGELIQHALAGGAARIVLGIGGSATNDAGAGMLQALGYRLRDVNGDDIGPGGAALGALARIEGPRTPLGVEITVACDVHNPLCGPNGASHVYGPQKGTTPAQVITLDHALGHFADRAAAFTGHDLRDTSGAGAAGGLGFALLAFLGAQLRPGIDIVAELTSLEARIAAAGLVITGEGRADAQSLMGKAVGGVLRLARQHGKPVIVLAGALGDGHAALLAAGATRVQAIAPEGLPAAESITRAAEFLRESAASAARGYSAR